MPIFLEVCATTIRSAIAAQEGSANRIELCVDLPNGGTSPPIELVREVREALEINIHSMIRPRSGDFNYSKAEFETMKSEIEQSKALGVNGVVFGILHADKSIDVERTKELVSIAYPLSVTFHRAFDETPDPAQALENVISAGADFLLTSGQKTSAYEGRALIKQLAEQAGNRIRIIAGAGITEDNVWSLLQESGVEQIHIATGLQKNGETSAGLVRRLIFSMNDDGEMN